MADEKRVLILEPDPTDAEVIVMQLRKAGLPLTSRRVGTKEMFDRIMAEFRPDIVVADSAVPRTDVFALVREQRLVNPDVQWLIVSGGGSEETAVEALKAGARDYVTKKNIGRLGPAVKSMIENPPPAPAQAEPEALPPQEPAPPTEAPPAAADDLFRRTVESTTDLIAVLDLEGKRIYNNPAYADLLDEPDTLEGTSSFVDVHPDDREEVKNVFRETVATGVGQRLEYRLVDRNGNIRYIESQGSVVRDADGNPDKIVIISRDISKRRMAGEFMRLVQEEIARNRGEEFFPGMVRALAETLGVKYCLVSECTDRRRDRVRALAYWAAGGPAPVFEYDVANTTCERVIKEAKTIYFATDIQQLFPDESALAAMDASSYLGTPLIDSGGSVIGHLFIIHDSPLQNPDVARSVLTVTAARAAAELEHRLALRVIAESEAHFHTLLEEMTAGVIVTDMEDVITFVNHRMSEMTGYEDGEMLGRLASTLLVPEEDRRLLYERNERRRKGLTERYESELKRKDGSLFTAQISASPHRNIRGEIIGSLALISPGGAAPAARKAPG
ncbi:MAG TPA: PAS domain S-box protein, partial [Bacteroidota bacterium]|nr:PAS domain S-box protein [Bacteroidota bacterium]